MLQLATPCNLFAIFRGGLTIWTASARASRLHSRCKGPPDRQRASLAAFRAAQVVVYPKRHEASQRSFLAVL